MGACHILKTEVSHVRIDDNCASCTDLPGQKAQNPESRLGLGVMWGTPGATEALKGGV